ncbi:MAG: class I SAM-dependent methyltransferase [Candidatus Obscuribacter sp.]|jgi:SAM-dependent methyltransferase|nr:class I SAM-dependent methyltransferase [Candidatus Obscuribacter sp.]MBK9772660.1 class I SAM-dependent methyltransferase [Candidatus Obscuribacter sp.]MDQ5967859.1 Class SAM-dependent methyltransferase [Cyanobacteriota bacterium erpe_2018_sw_39hr_WHONDRS-SW48-000098_B_bin.30]
MTNQQEQAHRTQRASAHDWDARYRDADLPWDSGTPADELVAYFASLAKDNLPGAVLEVGCGTGTNAVWLAQQGCKVTATEIAPTALAMARERAQKAGVEVELGLIDICVTAPVAAASQDFAFDRGVYHVISAVSRPAFVASLAAGLKPGGHWLSVAGSKDEHRDNPDEGPPQLSAVELLQDVEPLFALVKLERSSFVLPNGKVHLAWVALYAKR